MLEGNKNRNPSANNNPANITSSNLFGDKTNQEEKNLTNNNLLNYQ